VYRDDITVGEQRQLRGHWSDRLADIDADIAAVSAKLDSAKPAQADGPVAHAIAEALAEPQPRAAAQPSGRVWRAAIPSDYTGTPYTLQYYFQMADAPASAALFPGLGPMRTNQPYFVVRRS